MLKLSQPITDINGFRIGDKVRLKDGDGRPHIIKAFAIDGLKEFFFVVQFEDETETMFDNISPLPSNMDEAAEKYSNIPYNFGEFVEIEYKFGEPIGKIVNDKAFVKDAFKAGAEWQRAQYECIPTEEAYMRGFAQGAKEERKDLIPLINRLCEAILFEWKDAADLAKKTLIQIKEREEEK